MLPLLQASFRRVKNPQRRTDRIRPVSEVGYPEDCVLIGTIGPPLRLPPVGNACQELRQDEVSSASHFCVRMLKKLGAS